MSPFNSIIYVMNVVIENEFLRAEISSLGAEIHRLTRKSDSSEIIWNGDPSVWKNHAPVLFPFIARCLGGYFVIDGKRREFIRNHGFFRDSETELVRSDAVSAEFRLRENPGTMEKFPYSFSVTVAYTLSERSLGWKITVSNTGGRPFRFSVGTHAAFSCPRGTDPAGTENSCYRIEFEKREPLVSVVCTPEGYLAADEEGCSPVTAPYGEPEPGIIPLDGHGFGNGHLFTAFSSDWVGLRNMLDGSLVRISTRGFPYCMIWQNMGKPEFVCLEPWYGLPDAENTDHDWNKKPGMIDLEPGCEFTSIQDIHVG